MHRRRWTWNPRGRISPAEKRRISAYEAAHPGVRIHRGDFGEWYGDEPHGRSHAATLDELIAKLDAPDTG